MKKNLLSAVCSLLVLLSANAQVPDDALRNAWFIPGGTARNIATGGAMCSLGGDISANHVNPAGIGLYKTMEVVLSPGFMFNNNKVNYRDENSSANKSAFAYGTSGFIIGAPYNRPGSKVKSTAFSMSINQLANYNNHLYYKGANNFSSFSEQYLEELTRDNASPQAAEQNYIFGSSLAYRTYLIDSINVNGEFLGYKSLVPVATGIIQERDETTKGAYNELSLAFANNTLDKVYFGISINFPFVNYERDLIYKETDATGNPNNNFSDFKYTENFKSSGVGLNIKLGVIYKPQPYLRLGFALHSPSFIGFKDQVRSAIATNTEAYAGILSESSDNLNSGNPGERNYNLLTPWRAIASGSYVFSEVQDTKKQRGFITADIEYADYKGARFYSSDNSDQTLKDYYTSLNNTVKNYYKAAVNFRVGGEIKFDPWAIRLGGAYYGSPYSDTQLKANKLMLAGGFGYRNHGMFIDITYAQTLNKDVSFPYRLNDVANTFATWNNNRGNVIITVGFKI